MSDCPYVFDNVTVPNTVYFRYDPCNCGRPYPCFFGQPVEIVLPYFIAGAVLGLIPFFLFKIHLWNVTRNISRVNEREQA